VVATEALFVLTPQDRHPRCYRALDGDGIMHWWLECYRSARTSQDNEVVILDATADQFDGLSFAPPYADGKKTNFMARGGRPSKRTLDLVDNSIMKSVRYISYDKSYAPPLA